MKRHSPPPVTPPPDLSDTDTDMESFHRMSAGQLAETLYRFAGFNVAPFKRKPKRPDRP